MCRMRRKRKRRQAMQPDETKRQVPGGFDSELRGATWTWST
jgi:hypothetical protein